MVVNRRISEQISAIKVILYLIGMIRAVTLVLCCFLTIQFIGKILFSDSLISWFNVYDVLT